MKKFFYVAADFERNPEHKTFNIWSYASITNETAVLKAIDMAFYINRKYKSAVLIYGFTDLTEKQLEVELNK